MTTAPLTLTVPERAALRLTAAALITAGGLGLFLGYANPVAQVPPLALLLPACLTALASLMPTGRGAFYAGWLCSTLGHSLCLYWLAVPMHDFGQIPWILTAPCVLALGGYLGLYDGLFTLLLRLFRGHLPFFAALLLVAPLWAGLETARGYLFTGFPWVSLSTAFAPWPVWVQAASLMGAYALSGVFALVGSALAEAAPLRIVYGFGARPLSRSRKLAALALALLPTALVYAYGLHVMNEPLPQGRLFSIGLVQGNVNQDQKWVPLYQQQTLSRYLTLSERAVNPSLGAVQKPVDLLLWPETSMPFYFESNPHLARQLTDFSARFKTPIAFGAPGKSIRPDGGVSYHNRLWLYTPDPFGLQSYDKIHLVPFGEYVPLSLPLSFIEYYLQGLDFVPGKKGTILRAGDLALGPLICYEAIFPEYAWQRVEDGAMILVNISNDAWFGRTAAPEQHLQLTAMRAVEEGRFIVRSTNTGISAVIDPRGVTLVRSSLFRAETVIARALALTGKTMYHRLAPYLLWLCLLIPAAAALYCLQQRRRQN